MEIHDSGINTVQDSVGVMDLDGALALVMDDMELLCEIIEIFNEDYPKQLRKIKIAIKEGDGPLLRNAAHTIKGSISTFCAKRAFDLALKLEMMGREGDLSGADEGYVKLEKAVEELKNALDNVIASA